MYATQSSRFGVPRHATVTPLKRRRRRPSTFASGFRLPSIVALPLMSLRWPLVTLRRSGETEGRLSDEGRSWLANLTSVVISVSRLRLSARNAAHATLGALWAAWNRRIFGVVLSVDEGIGIFRGSGCEGASNRAIRSAVDNCGNVGKVWAFVCNTGADSAVGEEELEDLARQNRAARDESGEVTDGGRALAEQLAGFFGRVHAAGSDDLESPAEARARAAQGLERCGEELGPGEPAGPLREAGVLHAPGVAVVDDADPRLERRRDDLGLIRVGEIGRELHDERLVRGGPHRPEQGPELPRLPAPLVDQPGVRRRDVELDQVTQRAEPGDEPDAVIHGLAGYAHDKRHAVRQSGDGGAEALESRVLEPVAVDEPRARRAPDAHQVWLRMAWTRLHRDGLGGDGAEPEAHHAPEDPRIVVHRRQDQRVGQSHAAERDGEPRVVEAEDREPVPRQEAQRRLAEGDRGGRREGGKDAGGEEAGEGAGRGGHPRRTGRG